MIQETPRGRLCKVSKNPMRHSSKLFPFVTDGPDNADSKRPFNTFSMMAN